MQTLQSIFTLRSATGKQLVLAVLLCFIAGYLDGFGLIVLGTFISFMSGNTTQTGASVGQGKLQAAFPTAIAILFFVIGTIAGTLVMRSGWRQAHRIGYALIGALLAVVFAMQWHTAQFVHPYLAIALLSLGTGMINPAVSRAGAESIGLTFVTGTLNRMGGHLAAAMRREPLANAKFASDSHLARARVDLFIWFSFISGAIVAALGVPRLGHLILLPPTAAMIALALFAKSDPLPAQNSRGAAPRVS